MEPIFCNRALRALPSEEIRIMRPLMTRVRLVPDETIYEGGETIEFIYFMEDGLVSMMASFEDPHEEVQIDFFGRRDVVGLTAILNGKATSFHPVIVQMPGIAYRISTSSLRHNLPRLPTLERLLLENVDISHARIAQSFACRTMHPLSKRLARWLLMASDLFNSESLSVTQEFLAKMLAVRRPAVTVALGQFEAAAMIESRRGRIFLSDHDALRRASCDCDIRLLAHIEALLELREGIGNSDKASASYVADAHLKDRLRSGFG